MNYSELKTHDVANGPGVRVSLFVSGCEHACPGCFNPEAWQFSFGEDFTLAAQETLLGALSQEYIRGLTLLGGEPLHPLNRTGVLGVIEAVRAALPGKDIWCYSGYHFDKELLPAAKTDPVLQKILENIDVLVDGRFVMAQKNLGLRFRGSENQRILDMPASLRAGQGILHTLGE